MSKTHRSLPALSPAQQQLMDIIWQQGELSATELVKRLPSNRALARNTVCTMLLRMEEKGWLTHREVGRKFLYSAAMPRETTIGKKVAELIDTLCGGSPETLVTALLDHRGLSHAEARRIRAMVDDARHNKKDGGG